VTGYIVRRLIGVIPTLFITSLIIYAILLAAPGGPTSRYAQNPKMTPAAIAEVKKRWGLDQPIPIQYCRWVGLCNPNGEGPIGIFISDHGLPNFLPSFLGGGDSGVLHGDLGTSVSTGAPVTDTISSRILPTAILAGTALVVWLVLAFIFGIIAAVKRYSKTDTAITIFSYVGYSFPTFWLGLMLILVFAAQLKVLPASGMWDARTVPAFGTAQYWTFLGQQPLAAIGDLGRHLLLPVVTLVVVNVAADSRFIRASMIDSMNRDYVRTARAKGVPENTVRTRHALRNALLPVITNIALELPFLFTGAIVTETIFSWPGMGRESIRATAEFDYPTLMGILVITAVLVVLANLLADIVYAVADPRISYG
jgi:peptide/nickel transport system permease protein